MKKISRYFYILAWTILAWIIFGVFVSVPYSKFEESATTDKSIYPQYSREYENGFKLVQTNVKSDVYFKNKLIYTFDHDAVLDEWGSSMRDSIFFAPRCFHIDDTKKDTNGEKQNPISYLSQDQVRSCVRDFILFSLSPYSFNDSLLQVSLWFQKPWVIIDTMNAKQYIIDDDYKWSQYWETAKYRLFIGSEGLTIFDRKWNKVWWLYFDTEYNPSMTIDTGSWDDMRADRYIFAKFESVEEKPDGNIEVKFINGKWEEVVQKIIMNGDFPPYKQKTKIITQESDIGTWVNANKLEEWEKNERVSLPVSLCDIFWNCKDWNPPDKNSLEKFVTHFPHLEALNYFRDKDSYYSLLVRKTGDMPRFNILKNKPKLILIDGYIFEYNNKYIFTWMGSGIVFSDRENIQIRDDFLMDSKHIWPLYIHMPNFLRVNEADPKTFRPLTNLSDSIGITWRYMIDNKYCYWFHWDNNVGNTYEVIPSCKPNQLRYLWWSFATDEKNKYSWSTMVQE